MDESGDVPKTLYGYRVHIKDAGGSAVYETHIELKEGHILEGGDPGWTGPTVRISRVLKQATEEHRGEVEAKRPFDPPRAL